MHYFFRFDKQKIIHSSYVYHYYIALVAVAEAAAGSPFNTLKS